MSEHFSMAAMVKPNRPYDIALPTNGVPTGGSDAAVTAMAKGAPNVITYGTVVNLKRLKGCGTLSR